MAIVLLVLGASDWHRLYDLIHSHWMAVVFILYQFLDDVLVAQLDVERVYEILSELEVARLLSVYRFFRFLQKCRFLIKKVD